MSRSSTSYTADPTPADADVAPPRRTNAPTWGHHGGMTTEAMTMEAHNQAAPTTTLTEETTLTEATTLPAETTEVVTTRRPH